MRLQRGRFLAYNNRIHSPITQEQINQIAAKEPSPRNQQKENAADREIARKIRQSIVQDKSFSNYAHNVKVVVRDGQVTLKGPVRSEDEKNNIGAKAAYVAGADKVQNDLTIKS